MSILQRCRDARIKIVQKLKGKNSDFNIHTNDDADISLLNDEDKDIFNGTIKNRDILRQTYPNWEKKRQILLGLAPV
jgi:hypothetical protein